MCCYCDNVLLCASMWQSVAICDNVLLCVTICFYVRECAACECVSMFDNMLWIAAMGDDLLLLWLCAAMWQCVAICVYASLCVAIVTMCYYALLCDNQFLFVTVCCYVWQSVSMCENVLHVTVFPRVIMRCDLLLCVTMCCCCDYELLCAAMW
jgi:hypothetical protein